MKPNQHSCIVTMCAFILASASLAIGAEPAKNGLVSVKAENSNAEIKAVTATDFHVATDGEEVTVKIEPQPGWILVSPSKGKVSNGSGVKYAVRSEDGEGSDGGDVHTCFFPALGADDHIESPELAKPFDLYWLVREQNPRNPTRVDVHMHFRARTQKTGKHADLTHYLPCIWCQKLHDPVDESGEPYDVDFNLYTWRWECGNSYLEIEYPRNDFNPTIPMARGNGYVEVEVSVNAVWTGCSTGECEDGDTEICSVKPIVD